jgi:hypothetical protein
MISWKTTIGSLLSVLGIVTYLDQSSFAQLDIDLRLCQREYDLGSYLSAPLPLTAITQMTSPHRQDPDRSGRGSRHRT